MGGPKKSDTPQRDGTPVPPRSAPAGPCGPVPPTHPGHPPESPEPSPPVDPVMDRTLIIGIFLAIQAAAVAVAVQCYHPVCQWMTGGHWLSPAVRVPLVVVAVAAVELLVLAA